MTIVRADPLLAALAIGASIALALAMGLDTSWDLRNYHLYDAWAWWHGRLDVDVAPAQLQTYFSPFAYLPAAWLLDVWPRWLVTVALAAVHGACALPLLAILRVLLPTQAPVAVRGITLLAAMTGAVFVGELGTTHADAWLRVPMLCAVAILVRLDVTARDWARTVRRVALAGALLGACAGLKWSLVPVSLGLVLASTLLGREPRQRAVLLLACAVGAGIAFLATALPWMLVLQRHFGNPVFPFFGEWFASPWNPAESLRDLRFVPASLADVLLRPFAPAIDFRATSDYKLRDLRLPLLWIATLAWPWWRTRLSSPQRQPVAYLLVAFVAGYAAWLALFGYHRYLGLWEVLAMPIVVTALLATMRERAGLAIALGLLIVPATRPLTPARTPLRFDTTAWTMPRPASLAADTLLVLAGDAPTSYALPSLAPFARAVRIEGNLMGGAHPPFALDRVARDAIAEHHGPLALLLAAPAASVRASLAGVALRLDGTCTTIDGPLTPVRDHPLLLCPLARVTRGDS